MYLPHHPSSSIPGVDGHDMKSNTRVVQSLEVWKPLYSLGNLMVSVTSEMELQKELAYKRLSRQYNLNDLCALKYKYFTRK